MHKEDEKVLREESKPSKDSNLASDIFLILE